MRNCTRDEGGPFGFGNQVLISSHRKLLRSKAVVVSVAETSGQDLGRHGRERRAQANRCRSVESGLGDVRTGGDPSSGITSGDALILPERHPACRRREARPGFRTERENLCFVTSEDVKGQAASGSNREGESTQAGRRGGAARSSVEGPVMGLERRGCVVRPWPLANWKQEEPVDEAKPFKQRSNIGSRVTREGHARFWERPEVKFLRATRQAVPMVASWPPAAIGSPRPFPWVPTKVS